ncbi:LOW QUALITY PROTEIN: Hypothetical protein PHPALM_3468 [Phytophthora palmivora]|uniref:Uncharacterized protein n=1 Tax=Phytophthora palmivora TaxID=4796 RepID=A0A2P4YMG4_9STRA|nr:LOW QUALITY PROTEIN: Hypothetical protein PHPALM_3468 [Phytophthora palmivora]
MSGCSDEFLLGVDFMRVRMATMDFDRNEARYKDGERAHPVSNMRLKGNAVTPVEVFVVAEDGESGQYLHTTYTDSVICGHNGSERASMGARNQYQQHISTNSKREWALERVYQWMMSGEPNSERLDGEDDVNIGVGEPDACMLITKLLTKNSSDCPPATALDIHHYIDTGDASPIMLK